MKNTARMAALTASILLCGLSIPLFAQAPPGGPCPPGAVPIPGQGRCGSPAEASANRGGGSSRPVYTEVWEERFGAIAVDSETGNAGVIEGQKSKRKAESIAVKNCAVKSCKVVSSIRNGCHAVAWGGGYSSYGNDVEEAQAIANAMKICATTSKNCEIKYSGCSLPVRVK